MKQMMAFIHLNCEKQKQNKTKQVGKETKIFH